MYQLWSVGLFFIIIIQVEASNDINQNTNVDPMVLQRVLELQKYLLPLSEDVMEDLMRRSAALYLPVLADPGECRRHSKYTLERVLQADMWALRMIDASSKLPAGVLDGHIQDSGNYEQCLRINEPGNQFRGQHCLVEIYGILPPQINTFFRQGVESESNPGGFFLFLLCVPSSCTSQDIITHLNANLVTARLNESVEKIEVYCSTSERLSFRVKDWIAVIIFATLGLMVALSTWYESRATRSKSELFCTFSLISNWQELANTEQSVHEIPCLSGLRIILTLWTVISHRFMISMFLPIFNYTTYLQERGKILYSLIVSGNLGVESFLLIGGVVRSYSFMRNKVSKRPLNIIHSYIYRYFRATPTLAILILFSLTLNTHLFSGPGWEKCMAINETVCSYLWWSNILQISNLIPFKYMCRIESWYIAADYQLFVMSPLLLIPLYRRPRLGLKLVAITFTLSTAAKIIAVFVKELHPGIAVFEGPDRAPSSAHLNTVFRMGNYIAGIALGYLLFKTMHGLTKITLSKFTVRLCWVLSVLILISIPSVHSFFLRPGYHYTTWQAALYLGLGEQLFTGAVAWIILACTLGHGGWLNQLLSWPKLLPLSKLSFAVYLVHFSIQTVQIAYSRKEINYNIFDNVHLTMADLVISLVLATVLFLTVENPCYRVIKFLLRKPLLTKDLSMSSKTNPGKEKEKEN